jgi:hypothetical protein
MAKKLIIGALIFIGAILFVTAIRPARPDYVDTRWTVLSLQRSSARLSLLAKGLQMMIKETLVLAALAISSPAVLDVDTVRIAGVEDLPNRNVS